MVDVRPNCGDHTGVGSSMRRGNAVLGAVLALLTALPGAAAGGGPLVVARRPLDHSRFQTRATTPFFVPPVVVGDTGPVVVQVPVAVPVPVVVPPAPATVQTPPPPAPTYEMPTRPTVVNPGPKIIEISRPAPGAKTVTVTVHQGSSTVVETVPVQ